ncbi:hypothetical protein RB614_16600 [Phytohabitans sp. ZYX-F-186]|uniref:Uncharacterized protein n=1 Tax=Phytohabitans maris TaxID=3071409 RepID=A0ABU0ZGE6_9ACTN|nr:hypothetical protein [Phytohabitans sp. ZYX-F-186]MDQ7906133.1 hypothetical protein [Phytohabitans sp. ZYX-F-186]
MTDDDTLRRARGAAQRHTAAVRDMERFVEGFAGTPDAAALAEYAALLAREEATLADRQELLAALALEAPSVEP